MTNTIDLVYEFQDKFRKKISLTPHISDEKLNNFRIGLIEEELDELKKALKDKDPVEVLDALSDLQYVLDGAYLALGFSDVKHRAFEEVHKSNMTKLDGYQNPIIGDDKKLRKSKNYQPPNLKQFVSPFDLRKDK